jgi:hypothetical protein
MGSVHLPAISKLPAPPAMVRFRRFFQGALQSQSGTDESQRRIFVKVVDGCSQFRSDVVNQPITPEQPNGLR